MSKTSKAPAQKLSQADLDRLIPSLCTRCGKCCLNADYMGTLEVSTEDVRRWHHEGREDILHHVWSVNENVHDAWVTKDGDDCTRCPFVRKDRNAPTYTCRIHQTRPEPGRDYPVDFEQMEQDGCEIIGELIKRGIDATSWRREFSEHDEAADE
jgi:Fe-S-cluster containining protein